MQVRAGAPFGVNVIGFVSARLGLGVAARASVAALVAADVPVAVVDVTLPDGRSGFDRRWAHLNIADPARLPHAVNLVHVNPPEAEGLWRQFPHWFAGGVNACVPFFELADVPNAWLAHLTRYDAILAPSEHIAGAIRNAVATPVRAYPIAADVGAIVAAPRARHRIPENRFAFAATYDTDSGLHRKNVLGTVRAFSEAFAGRNDAVLVLKRNGIATQPEVERELATLPPGSVVVVDEYLSYDDVLGLYAACDAFVSLHRAEGLGLGLMEAMLLEKPVIATGWSGNMDFIDESCAELVRYTFAPVIDTQAAYAPGQFARPQLWAEPDLLDAAQRMRRLVDDREYARRIAAEGLKVASCRKSQFFQGGAARAVARLRHLGAADTKTSLHAPER